MEIESEGRLHDGLDDAVNTGYLIEKLEMNPEYKLVSYEMPEQEQGHLSCTLSLRKILLFRKEYVNKMYGLMSEETFDNIMREFKEESDK